MSARVVVLTAALAATGCGFGFGGVYGPKNYPAGTISLKHFTDPWCRYSCEYYTTSSSYDAMTSHGGLLVGYRRGFSWAHLGDAKVEGASSAEGHLTGYYGPFSLGVGYTGESGRVVVPYNATTLKGEVSYAGFFVEPSVGLNVGPLYAAFTLAVISGETGVKFDGNSHTDSASGTGFRPGGRIAIGLFKLSAYTFKLAADVRYLISPDATLGAGTPASSYGGWSTVFGLNAMM